MKWCPTYFNQMKMKRFFFQRVVLHVEHILPILVQPHHAWARRTGFIGTKSPAAFGLVSSDKCCVHMAVPFLQIYHGILSIAMHYAKE